MEGGLTTATVDAGHTDVEDGQRADDDGRNDADAKANTEYPRRHNRALTSDYCGRKWCYGYYYASLPS